MPKPAPDQRGQIFTVEDGVVVVEWYSFGEDVAYEFAKQIRLNHVGQTQMSAALGITDVPEPEVLKDILKDRFGSYWAVREFADANAVSYEAKTDMWP